MGGSNLHLAVAFIADTGECNKTMHIEHGVVGIGDGALLYHARSNAQA